MLRTLIQIVLVLMVLAAAPLRAVDPSIAFAVTSNGQPVSAGQTVSGMVNITVTVTNAVDMHVAAYGNMIFLPFNEPGHRADTPVWSHTTQVDTRRFYDGENLLSVHVHPHNLPGGTYIADFTFGTFKLVSQNSNPAPNGDRLLPTLSIGSGWTPAVDSDGEYYLSGDASVVDDKTSSGVSQFQTAPVQIIAHLGESVLGRFRWSNSTPPFGDRILVSQCHLRPFQRDQAFNTKVVFFSTDGAGRANYATRAFSMPALPTNTGVDLPKPFLDAKILSLRDGDTLRVPDGGTAPLYVQVSNLSPGVMTYPQMTTWIGNSAVKVTNLLPYLQTLPEGATSVIVEVPIPADEVQRLQAARQGGEMSTATPIWVDFNNGFIPCLPVSSHIHLNSVRTTSYPWPYGQPTVVIQKPWNNSAHWTGTNLVARYDQWGPLPSGYQVRWKLNSGAWQVDDGDGLISLSGLARQSHLLEIELTDAAFVRLPGTGSFAAANFTVADVAPVAVADVYAVVANGSLSISGSGVLLNDQDSDGDPITALLTRQPRHGTVSLASNGSFIYVPALGFVGFDRFTYSAYDNTLSSSETDVRIQVTAATSGARVLGDWPMLGRDAEHAGHMSGYLGSTAPTLSWTAGLMPSDYTGSQAIKGSVVVGGKVVTSGYISNGSYGQILVACFNATSGQREWETLFNVGSGSGPAIGNGMVYVQRSAGSSDSQMIALDLSSGAIRWSTPYADNGVAEWAPTLADGGLWVSGGQNGGLYGYDAITGVQRFFQALPSFEYWTPAYRSGKVFTWLPGTISRHDALTGAVELTKVLAKAGGTNVNTMPVLAEDRLVSIAGQRLIVVDPTDFSVKWQRMMVLDDGSPYYWFYTPVVHDGIVYALSVSSLEAFDLTNGRRLGKVSFPGSPNSSTPGFPISVPIVTDDMIIVSYAPQPGDHRTMVIDRATLSVRYTLPHGGSLALAGNALYITESSNNAPSPRVHRYVFNSAVPTVTWTAASQSSVNESGTLTVTAQLSAASAQSVSVPFTVAGTATGSDYTITASPITFLAGATTATVTIVITADTLDETNESVMLHMGTPTNAMLGATTVHTATIPDDDATPTVTWTTGSQSSTNESGTLTVTAQLTAISGQNVSIPFTVTGTATGSDYTITASPITILAGATTATATIAITADTLNEANETVILAMGAPTNAMLGATTVHTATITNDDATPTVTWMTGSQSSTNESGTLTVTAQLSAASGQNVTVPFTVTGTATSGSDYVISATSPITIPAGAISGTIKILIVTDMTVEENETVVLTMGTPTNATAGATTVHTATISNVAPVNAVEPGIAITVTSNGQPVSEGQTVSGVVNITVTAVNAVDMHVATYGNMMFLPFNEPGHRANTPVWSHTTQVDTRRFYDGENLLSVHVHPHNLPGQAYIADFTFGTFKLVSQNSNSAPNGDLLLPTLSIGTGWTPTVSGGEYYLSGDASVVDDKTSSDVGRGRTEAAPVQIIAHLGESVLGRFRWNTFTPPFGDNSLVSQCHLRPFQRDYVFNTKVVFFFTDGAGRANYATRAFSMPALPTTPGVDLPLPHLDAKILGLGDGDTLRVPDGGTAPLYVQVSNLAPGVWTYPEMTTWIGNRAVKVTKLLPYLQNLPEGATSVIVEVPIPADEVQRLQAARQGGEMSTATPIWVDFNQGNVPCLPVSSHIHLNSVRTTSYPWPYGAPTVVIQKPWNNSAHWTGTTLVARYDQWGPLPSGYRVRWKLNSGAWQVDDGDGLISLSGLTRQSHLLEIELTDAAFVRLPGTGSFAAANFTVINTAPLAAVDIYAVVANGSLNISGSGVLLNDQDSDGDPITALLASQPRHGTVSLASNGSFTYVPAPGFVGFDRFTYRASDGTLSSTETDVRIQVTAATSGARVLGDWPMLGRDAEHTGYVGGFLGSVAPTLSWSVSPAGNWLIGSPVVVGGKVVFKYRANGGTRVACFNATSGQSEWETLFSGGDLSDPAIGNGLVYIQQAIYPSGPSQMIALDLTSGAIRWRTPFSSQSSADWAPTVADGSLWASGVGGLYGYDAITGSQRFLQALPNFDKWTPAYRSGKLFTWLQGTVRRHHALTGVVELSKVLKPLDPLNGAVNGSAATMPVLVGNRLVLLDQQQLTAVDPTDFSICWQRVFLDGYYWVRTPVVHDGIVYALTGNSLEVLDLANGRQLGVVALPSASSSTPIVTDDAIIVSCDTTYPYTGVTLVIDRASLSVRYTLPYGGSLALADNALYITDSSSNIAAPSVRRYSFAVAPPAVIAPTITLQPTSVTLAVGATATFSVVASGTSPLTYQWKQGTMNVGTNSATLSIANAQTVNAGSYTCVVSNSAGTATSNAATLTVNTAPTITKHPVSVTVLTGQTATFSVVASSTSPLTYQWKQGTTNVGTNSAMLSIANAQSANAGSYTCVVTNSFGAVTSIAASLTVSATNSGFVRREWWNGISGTTIASLTSNAAFPNSPTGSDLLNIFEIGTNTAENYGTRMRGYVIPPTTGNYTFWIAGDDNCELWLSTNTDTLNRTRIAYVSSWTNSRAWTALAGQQSALIPLVAGQKYYVEALHKEGGGGDNLAVGWQLPDLTMERPIPGLRLEAFAPTGNMTPTITSHPASVTVTAGQTATFTVVASGTAPLTYQWKQGATNVGTNSATLSMTNAQAVNAGSYTCVVTNTAGTATSNAATLTVNSTNPPLYQVGLRAEFFDSTTSLAVIPNLGVLVPNLVRTDAQIAYASVNTAWTGLPSTMADTFASRHSGWLKIDTAGTYTLFISSDDGSRVYLNGALVIDNEGLHGMQERSVTLSLAAGFHPLRVEFFENTGGCGLQFSWSGPAIAKQLVPASALWQSPSSSVVGVPLPWIAADVGPVKVAGSANGNGVDFSITGGGAVALGTTSSTNITDYTLCANEGQSFALPGLSDVAYGANGVFAFRSNLSGTVVFNNATFGDPIPGVAKKGYYRLSGAQDAFQMVYRPLTVNGELIARVVWMENTNAAARAGVMVRDSITSSSVNAFVAISPTSGAIFQSRTATGGATASTVSAGIVAPYWVRVVRIGTTVTGWMSSDGITWIQVGAAVTLPLGATPIIGLGVTGGNNDLRALGIFDQVLFIPYAGG